MPLVLAYHGVATVPFDRDRYRLFVSPEQVARDVGWLRRRGYELVTFGEATRRRFEPDARLAALTFDDGLDDNHRTLLPLLARLAAPATVFVIAGRLGAEHPDAPGHRLLDAEGVRALHRAGIEIGAHGVEHVALTSVTETGLEREVAGGRAALEAIVEAEVRSLAYPFGAANDAVRAAVAEAGFSAACRTSGQGDATNPLDQPRQAMGHGSSVLGLHLKEADRYETLLRVPGVGRVRRVSRRVHSRRAGRRAGGPTDSRTRWG